jgi:hypothetical protein
MRIFVKHGREAGLPYVRHVPRAGMGGGLGAMGGVGVAGLPYVRQVPCAAMGEDSCDAFVRGGS